MRESIRDRIGKTLVNLGENNDIYVVDCDMAKHTKLDTYFKKYPQKSFQMGISEQNGMSFAAGLSTFDKPVVISSFAMFIVGRAWEQIRHSISYNSSNVKIIGTHSGLSAALDGASHHMLEDIALTCSIPNMIVLSPIDPVEGQKMVEYSILDSKPYYIRIGRDEVKTIFRDSYEFKLGMPVKLTQNDHVDTVIISTGEIGHEALKAEKLLREKNILINVIHIPTLKPLNIVELVSLIGDAKNLIVVEEHSIYGGLSSIISNALIGKIQLTNYRTMSLDTFTETGTYSELKCKYKLDYLSIVKEVLDIKIGE